VIFLVDLTAEGLSYFSLFEKITGVFPSDYVGTDNGIIFLVEMKTLGKAIGRKGANINKLKSSFRKKVVIVGDSKDPEKFARNFFGNLNLITVELREAMGDKTIFITVDEKDRGFAIGKSGERIKAAKTFFKKKFNTSVQLKTKRVMELS